MELVVGVHFVLIAAILTASVRPRSALNRMNAVVFVKCTQSVDSGRGGECTRHRSPPQRAARLVPWPRSPGPSRRPLGNAAN
ncbi:hypothetical protein RR46_02808 [Papilio xuthus]|uniref:Secreted protein n=1 Tax=Papilio xuthus TaxID=66420 RepID=A0A194QHG1_PAPXU|nr:hypothetical protein RR46_02808 [Papilio xuthus]